MVGSWSRGHPEGNKSTLRSDLISPSHFSLGPCGSMLYCGAVIASLWHRGQRLGRVILLRSRKAKPQ